MSSALDVLLERHEREKHAHFLLTEPERKRAEVRAHANYIRNPWAFLRDCVWTRDAADQTNPFKPYPDYLEYLQFVVGMWSRERFIAIPKSRRMTMSWTLVPLHLHSVIFHPGRNHAFVSKKQDDAAELVARAEFIFNKIPDWRIPKELLPTLRNGKMSLEPPVLDFEGILSKIEGYPMGANQLRQFGFSRILGDECAFWEQAEDFYVGAKPTTDGGGGMDLISSRSPGFFKKIVFDRINHPDLNFPEEPPVPVQRPLTGVECWKNPENGFFVIDLHYTANPEKRSAEWVRGVRSSMPIRKFQKEYEKTWQTFEGLPVFADFDRASHVVPELEAEVGMPLLLGWDFGLTPACVIAQLVEGNLRILREFTATNEALQTFAPKVWSFLRTHHTAWANRADEQILSYIDPAGFQRAQTDARTCADVLRKAGFSRIERGPEGFEERRGAVENFLIRRSRSGSGMQIDARFNPVLIEGFAGGYQYPEHAAENEPAKLRPLKNAWSHVHDATQYLAGGATALARKHNITLTAPSYGFQQRGEATAKVGYGRR